MFLFATSIGPRLSFPRQSGPQPIEPFSSSSLPRVADRGHIYIRCVVPFVQPGRLSHTHIKSHEPGAHLFSSRASPRRPQAGVRFGSATCAVRSDDDINSLPSGMHPSACSTQSFDVQPLTLPLSNLRDRLNAPCHCVPSKALSDREENPTSVMWNRIRSTHAVPYCVVARLSRQTRLDCFQGSFD